MAEFCDLQIHINGQQTFFTNERIVSNFCGKLRKIIKQEKRRTQIRNSGIEIDDFPGGAEGFEQAIRFCYNNGAVEITVSNVSLLHCCAIFLGMTEKLSNSNLLHLTEIFLQEIFYWSWNDIIICLKSCESFFSYADSSGLIQKLLCSLLAKIAQNSDVNLLVSSSSSSSSSPDKHFNSGELKIKPSSSRKEWWFEDMTTLHPKTIEQFVKTLGAYGNDNNSLVLTRFLLHYLKTAVRFNKSVNSRISEYSELANTAVHGVILMGKTSFSCRGLFWVLRIVSGLGLSRECQAGLERLIGGMLDQATLDDLLIFGGHNGGAYDVNLVVRLIRLFVHDNKVNLEKMKKVGRLMDKYLGEIGPDQHLKVSKFLGIAQSLPDCSRDCYDDVYKAVDIYLQSHPALSLEERSRLCRCLNYEKLGLEACKDLAKNPRIPPRIAIQALSSQHSIIKMADDYDSSMSTNNQLVLYNNCNHNDMTVKELEKVFYKERRGQMSTIPSSHNTAMPRFC
ncbi:BTB/POZ domain-containing protein [Forsythia ovata]|uniref:BTB/POZ domain-containing protein n=1 Tax=Forsythia ovata TaxID=205694 RepID=A0ABD1XA19_9LAMI